MHAKPAFRAPSAKGAAHWLYGWHACIAALNNAERSVARLVCTENAARELPATTHRIKPEIMATRELDNLLGKGAVHQGIALCCKPLEPASLHEVLGALEVTGNKPPILLLDQITDPHNIGAILRSAAAFGVACVVTPKDHGARESAAMAKAACGALDMVPLVEVTNLAQAIGEVKEAGYWVYGLDGRAPNYLHDHVPLSACALVLGAEGKGMRRLTAELCDHLVKLPMDDKMESLNVSNAAAIALYQAYLSVMGGVQP
jgi:23S rRNA (guanosine2251-2'-O)-methyltransferase